MKKWLRKVRLMQQQNLQLKLSRRADNILITNPGTLFRDFFVQ